MEKYILPKKKRLIDEMNRSITQKLTKTIGIYNKIIIRLRPHFRFFLEKFLQ